jgi:EAL and modified HD-GYP domain-containing signal transduction protein
MNPKTSGTEAGSSTQPEAHQLVRHIARQPVLDAKGRLFGYELLFRSGWGNSFDGDGDQATRTMLDNTLLFGVDQLSSGVPVFINCTRESLLRDLVRVLSPEKAILEILETVVPDQPVIDACRKLRKSGYRLALDDFVWKPEMAPLVELADFIKIDVLAQPADEHELLLRQLRHSSAQLVAEKVETPEDFEVLKKEGFGLFQGYYFCRPLQSTLRRIPSNAMMHLELLGLVQQNPIDILKIGLVLRRDVSLTYRLLRLVNSPLYGMRQEIRSIEHALMIAGDRMFRRLVLLGITQETAGPEGAALLHLALQRSRFCELAACQWNLDPDEQCLLGLMSLLPAMLKVKTESIAEILPIRAPLRQAMLGAGVRERRPLLWLESFESGDWEACEAVAKHPEVLESGLVEPYAAAIRWADEACGQLL